MTCYFRHLQHVFRKAGIEVTDENKREIDKIIHGIVRVEYKDCPATWKEARKRIAEGEEDFVSELKEAWSKRQQSPLTTRKTTPNHLRAGQSKKHWLPEVDSASLVKT